MESWLRFANLQLPYRLANALLERFGAPDALFAACPAEIDGIAGLTAKQAARIFDLSFLPTTAQLRFVERSSTRMLVRGQPDYPARLLEIPDPAPVLFARGDVIEKDRFAVAVVGSRSASPYGRSVTGKLARELAQAGLTVVSGGAVGIDAAAHRSAFEAGGRTLVVLGCGLDVEYPRENQALFDQIVRGGQGAIISEFPLGATPEPWRFPMRNRLVSGLAMGVVVVEAGEQSGALLTATNAGDQGREVMAVPGNVDRPGCRGTNALIRDGATLVRDARDVMEALGMLVLDSPPVQAARPAPVLPPEQQALMSGLSLTPRHIDAIAAEAGVTSAEAGVQLTLMELGGLVRRLPGNTYIRVL